ncbi:MAG: hypothetical protein ACR2PA_09645, partial [Hyphomicrobiaceae bacterium]
MTLRPAADQVRQRVVSAIGDRGSAGRSPLVIADLLASRLLWCLVALAFVAFRGIAQRSDKLVAGVGDTDDAMRLVQVREFVTHGDWFNLQISQMGAPEVLFSHWSRLLDVPLAILVSLFGLVFSPDTAELLMRTVWPLLLLAALSGLVVREVERQGGAWATGVVLFLIISCAAATVQFSPGRIDHHNLQNLCAVGGILLLLRSLTEPRIGWWAGALLGLGLGVGLEALPLIAVAVGSAALVAAFDTRLKEGVWRCCLAMAGAVALCFVVTTPAARWFDVVCDANAMNLVALVGIGAIAMTLMMRLAPRSSALTWIGGLAFGGGLGIAVYVGLEPACTAGPFGLVDPAIKPIWLDNVVEVRSILDFAETSPAGAMSVLAVVGLGVCARYSFLWERRDSPAVVAFVITLAAALYSCIYLKLMPYAVWLAMVPTAVWIARLTSIGNVPAYTVIIAAAIFASQTVLILIFTVGLGTLFDVAQRPKNTALADAQMCQPQALYQNIARLPAGLVASHVNTGPFIVRNTPHRAVAGPYHRLDKSILATHQLLASAPTESRKVFERLGVDYLLLCSSDSKRLSIANKDALI